MVVVDLASVPLFARFVMHVLQAGNLLMNLMNTAAICAVVLSQRLLLKSVKWFHA